MNISIAQDTLVALLLCSVRCVAWLSIAPPIGTSGVPRTVKAVFGVALGLVMVPSAQEHVPVLEFVPILGALVIQVVIGVALGFLTRLMFVAVEAAGGLIDMFTGFTLAMAYDPTTKSTSSIFGKFYALLCTTLIFATNVHLVIFRGFLRTFDALPLDAGLSLAKLDTALVSAMTQMFLAALQIGGPLLLVLFIADIALGVLNRISPQLNAFQLSFPIKIGAALLLVGLGFALMPHTVVQTASRVNDMIAKVVA